VQPVVAGESLLMRANQLGADPLGDAVVHQLA
jgi:hypothetical protein